MELFALMSLALVAGVVSFTSPCTLPLLPGFVSYVSGLSGPGGGGGGGGGGGVAVAAPARRRVLVGSLLFLTGFATVFTALGATSSALGFLLIRNLRTINLVGGAFIVLMGLATLGVLRLPLLHRQARSDLTRWRPGPAGALPMGAAFAFGWTPCVGPVLASVLATAATTSTVGRGALLLLAYSLGLGLPFLLVARGVVSGRGPMSRLRRWSRRIEIAGGVLLVGMGVAMMTGGWTELMSRMLAFYARLGWPPI